MSIFKTLIQSFKEHFGLEEEKHLSSYYDKKYNNELQVENQSIDKKALEKETSCSREPKPFGANLRILVFSDLHYVSREKLEKLKEIKPWDYDIVLLAEGI